MRRHIHTGAFVERHAAIYTTNTVLMYRVYACTECGELIDPEPSNDDDERVKVEMRAAEVGCGRDTLNTCARCEACGWLAHKDDLHHEPQKHHIDSEFHAGYLAREIATHKEP